MTANHFSNKLLGGKFRVQDHLVLYSGSPIGVLNPATLLGANRNNQNYIYGILGRANVTGNDTEDIWAALIASGSVLFGSTEEAIEVASHLKDDRMSRTTSYICCLSKDCSQVINIINKIRAASVVVVGCGGIGSLAALLLSGAGIKHLKLIDPDTIEASNLNRQLIWKRSDIGRPKVEVLKREITERFLDIKIDTLQKQSTKDSLAVDIKGSDAILLSADSPLGISSIFQKAAKAEKIPLIATGYLLREAGITLSITDTPNNGDIEWTRSPFSIMPSFGPTNAELAGISCSLIIHAIAGILPLDQKHLSAYWDLANFPRKVSEDKPS